MLKEYFPLIKLSHFLDAFVKLRKAAISFVMSVRMSASNMSAAIDEFSLNLIFATFPKSVQQIHVS